MCFCFCSSLGIWVTEWGLEDLGWSWRCHPGTKETHQSRSSNSETTRPHLNIKTHYFIFICVFVARDRPREAGRCWAVVLVEAVDLCRRQSGMNDAPDLLVRTAEPKKLVTQLHPKNEVCCFWMYVSFYSSPSLLNPVGGPCRPPTPMPPKTPSAPNASLRCRCCLKNMQLSLHSFLNWLEI